MACMYEQLNIPMELTPLAVVDSSRIKDSSIYKLRGARLPPGWSLRLHALHPECLQCHGGGAVSGRRRKFPPEPHETTWFRSSATTTPADGQMHLVITEHAGPGAAADFGADDALHSFPCFVLELGLAFASPASTAKEAQTTLGSTMAATNCALNLYVCLIFHSHQPWAQYLQSSLCCPPPPWLFSSIRRLRYRLLLLTRADYNKRMLCRNISCSLEGRI
ncbi:UNVERIFIED_CONTAM: hypothetical protein K2H54_034307 [Gekko kuhli]